MTAPQATKDRRFLNLAARIASRAAGDAEPNPLVGAVIVQGDQIIGMGHHRRFGGPHAEREAIADAVARHGPQTVRGATVYVTLEPCAHTGKTPPCTDALIQAGVAEVVISRRDPHEAAAGGADLLLRHGIKARFSRASVAATSLADPFVKRITTGLPWVIAKWAQTVDGRIATRTGESKWISGERSRRRVHRLRSRVDAILTGIGTVLADDPMLDARNVARVRRTARRIVVDPALDTPLGARIVQTARQIPTTIVCAEHAPDSRATTLGSLGVEVLRCPARSGMLDLSVPLRLIAEREDATNVLVEAGAGVLGALFAQDIVDEAQVFIAPLVIGDDGALPAARGRTIERLADASRFRLLANRRIGDDAHLVYRRPPPASVADSDQNASDG